MSKDEFLGLNRCNGAEKSMIRILCKSFFVKFCVTPKNTYLKRSPESRVPTLTFLDYFTAKKVAKNFARKRNLFFDNTRNFRQEFKPYEDTEKQEESTLKSKKLTNRELEDIEKQSISS